MAAVTLKWVKDASPAQYRSECGWTLTLDKEGGDRLWVLKNAKGEEISENRFRDDIAHAFDLKLVD